MLHIKNVKKHFGGIKAVNGATFSIEKGKITALIGPNGAGKTTLFDVISGLLKPTSGEIYFNKNQISGKRCDVIANYGISRTFQQVRLFRNLTILDHMLIAMDHSDTYIIPNMLGKNTLTKQKKERINEVLELVGLTKSLNTYADALSYGQRKLLDLAIAIIKPHTLLMLDEPVAGVNPALRKKIKQILKTLKKGGATLLIIEHDMNFLMDVSDHVVVMDEGKVLVEGKPSVVQKDKRVLAAYLGE